MRDETRGSVWVSFVAVAAILISVSCKKEENGTDTPPTGGYQITLEDSTVVTIPGSAVTFAQQNFSRDAQLLREYQVATNSQYVNPTWQLPFQVWKSETYGVRQGYMVPPYDNDVMTDDSAFFYYEIGEFIEQFGYGWKDTFDAANFNPDSAYTNHLWPSDPTQTVFFDGQSPFREEYVGMWVVE